MSLLQVTQLNMLETLIIDCGESKLVKFLDLVKQYTSIKSEIDEAIFSTVKEAAFIGGKRVSSFEKNFAEFQNVEFCIGVGNGTDALEIAIEAANLPMGSEIIVPGNSFIASAEAVTRSGHKVVFADVDNECYTITADTVKRHITSNTSAIIAVHLYGHPCDMDSLMQLANERGLIVIEDCAQAHAAEYKGKRVGSLGHFGTFSFYPGKNLGAYGDGGAITTQSEDFAIRARKIANHGRIAKYDHEFEGRNSRLDGIQAAILDVKLTHLEKWTQKRIEVADKYIAGLSEISGLTLPVRKEWARQVYHLFVVRVKNREKLQEFLKDKGIQTGIHYPISLAKLDAYKYLDMGKEETFYNTTDSELLSLPIGEHLSDIEVQSVIDAIIEFYN